VSVTVNELNLPPILAPIANQTVTEGSALSFGATAQAALPEFATDPLSYSLVGAPAGASINAGTGAFTWATLEGQDGTYNFVVRVTDTVTNLSAQQVVSVTVNELNLPPVLAPITNQTVTEGSALSFGATAQAALPEFATDPLSYSLVGAPAGAGINANTGAFTWATAVGQSGTYNFVVRVTDTVTNLSAQQVVAVTVNPVAKAPTLDPIGPATVTATEITFTAQATNPVLVNGVPGPLTWSLVGAPAGATIDPNGVFHWTPRAGQLGSFTFKVGVSNGQSAPVYQPATVTTLGVVNGNLVVVGTAGTDSITVFAGNRDKVRVVFNGHLAGTFAVTGNIFVYGLGGDDNIRIVGDGKACPDTTADCVVVAGSGASQFKVKVVPGGSGKGDAPMSLHHFGTHWVFGQANGLGHDFDGWRDHHPGAGHGHDWLHGGWSDLVADLHEALDKLLKHS
jgi:hypothetical protein